MIDATEFRRLMKAYDAVGHEPQAQALFDFLLSHATELLALVEASSGKPMLIDGNERTTVRIFTPYAPPGS